MGFKQEGIDYISWFAGGFGPGYDEIVRRLNLRRERKKNGL